MPLHWGIEALRSKACYASRCVAQPYEQLKPHPEGPHSRATHIYVPLLDFFRNSLEGPIKPLWESSLNLSVAQEVLLVLLAPCPPHRKLRTPQSESARRRSNWPSHPPRHLPPSVPEARTSSTQTAPRAGLSPHLPETQCTRTPDRSEQARRLSTCLLRMRCWRLGRTRPEIRLYPVSRLRAWLFGTAGQC